MKATARKTTAVKLESLPPTASALQEHTFRAYHQVQKWRGNDLPPEGWGWELKSGEGLQPVTTEAAPAPIGLLKLISCSCSKPCGKACGCIKAGLLCSIVCKSCNENGCENFSQPKESNHDENSDDSEEDESDSECDSDEEYDY